MDLEKILSHHEFDLSSWSIPEYQRAGKEHLIYLLRVPSDQALEQWEILRNLVPETGYWPVLCWGTFKQPPWEEEPVQDILEAATHVDLQQWFAENWLELHGEKWLLLGDQQIPEENQAIPLFAFRRHLGRFASTPAGQTPLALVPTAHFWEVPAYLTAQGSEWDPPDAVHIAIMKYWHERWEAELVSLSSGVLEMRVLQPPRTYEEALALAKEQFVYAPDLVEQYPGGGIKRLARILLNSPVWYFWWD